MDKIPAMIARVDQAIAEGDYVLAAALINQVYARYDQLAAGHTVERVAVDRYFFNIYDGFAHEDKVGTEHPSLEAAQRDAVRLLSELLAPDAKKIWSGQDWYVEVTNSQRVVVFSLKFAAAVEGSLRVNS